MIDEVDQVIRVTPEEVDNSVEQESVKGVIRGGTDDSFVIWIDPVKALNL